MDEKEFDGKCPICREQLQRIGDGKVECPAGHYRTAEKLYRDIWVSYPDILTIPQAAFDLLDELLDANEIK